MTLKHNRFTQKRYLVSGLVLLAVIVTATIFAFQHTHTEAAPSVKPGVGAAVPSQFTFTGTAGWWQGATNKTSVAVFHNAQDCFVSVQHNAGTVAAQQAKTQSANAALVSQGYTITPIGTQTLSIQTSEGLKQYQLSQSSVTTPSGGNKVEGGQEFAYLPLSSGHLYVEGYCDTPVELPATIPALQAFKLNENK